MKSTMFSIFINLCIIKILSAITVLNDLDPDTDDSKNISREPQFFNNQNSSQLSSDVELNDFLFSKEWNMFKKTNKKVYKSKVLEKQHMLTYLQNAKAIENHNKKYKAGLVTYKLDTNQFADMMYYEFNRIVLNAISFNMDIQDILHRRKIFPTRRFRPSKSVKIPDSIDWRERGAVTPVKDQGYCGSCWAFSTTGSLEGQTFLKTGKLISLSEQNLMDCSQNYGTAGCAGGLEAWAFRYIRNNGGINTNESYPYNASLGICRFKRKNNGATVKGLVDIEPGNENHLKIAVATVGPISVGVNANGFQFYSDGIYNNKNCSKYILNHSVVVVGYGRDPVGGDYWLVKNSWGVNWGKEGYIKLARNKNNICGIAQNAVFPLV